MGKGWVGGPGSVICRVSYVNTDRNFNKLYFKHVSACPKEGGRIQGLGPGLCPQGGGLESCRTRLDWSLLSCLIVIIIDSST